MNVFVSKKIADIGLNLMREAGFTVIINKEERDLSEKEIIDACKNCDGFLSAGNHKLDKALLEKMKHLKGIALHSVGYDHVDLETATKLKVPIGNTPRVLDKSTSDIAFLLMLAVSRNAIFKYEKIKKGDWEYSNLTEDLGIELHGKTLGILGLGRIGYEMAKKCAAAFDMKIIYHNRSKNKDAEKDFNAMYVPFDELLRQSDVVSVHANLSEETEGLFNAEAFAQMKPSAIFVNTARGGLHNERDLIEALKKRIIFGAGLDVTNPEPMQKDNPLLKMPYVCVLPHIGSATVETRNAMSQMAANNLIAALKGKEMPSVVNPDVYT